MSIKFSAIVTDCPWSFDDKLKQSEVKRGAEANYSVMNIANIKKLPIADLADSSGALLALWVPSALLQEGLDVFKAWGFLHRQTYVWVKTKKKIPSKINNINDVLTMNLGRLFRQTHEICLLGINNTGIYKKLKNKSQRSVSLAENIKHSAKPENLQNSLDLMFPSSEENPINKLELFARRQRKGYFCLGNENKMTEKEDIFTSIDKLKSATEDLGLK